jgi:hypothetical protein
MGDDDDDWKVAEAALEKARGLPGGAERIEALRQAGRLRFEANKKRQKDEKRHPGPKSPWESGVRLTHRGDGLEKNETAAGADQRRFLRSGTK